RRGGDRRARSRPDPPARRDRGRGRLGRGLPDHDRSAADRVPAVVPAGPTMRGQKVALAAAVVVLAASAFAAGRYVRPGPHPGATGAAAATAAPVVRASFPPVSRFAK